MDKKRLSIFISSIFLLYGLLVTSVALCSTSAAVSVTVTAKTISVSVSNSTVAFGTLTVGTASSTVGNGTQKVITNNGTVTENIGISTGATTEGSGTAWTLADTAGSDLFKFEATSSTGSSWLTTTSTNSAFIPGLAANATSTLDFRLTMPTVSTDTNEKTITATILAIEA